MEVYRVVSVSRHERVSLLCDICQKTVDTETYSQNRGGRLELDCAATSDDGDRFGDEARFDVCKACVMEKVVPALVAVGLPIKIGEFQSHDKTITKFFCRTTDPSKLETATPVS